MIAEARQCGSLGSRGHEADDRGGRSFVNVGRPYVEGRGCNFESQTDEHQRDGDVTRLRLAQLLTFANDVDVGSRSRRT